MLVNQLLYSCRRLSTQSTHCFSTFFLYVDSTLLNCWIVVGFCVVIGGHARSRGNASFGGPALSSTSLLTLNPQLIPCSAESTFYNGIHETVYSTAMSLHRCTGQFYCRAATRPLAPVSQTQPAATVCRQPQTKQVDRNQTKLPAKYLTLYETWVLMDKCTSSHQPLSLLCGE